VDVGPVPSRQPPNHPGYWQDELCLVVVDAADVVVTVGAGTAEVVVMEVVVMEVVVDSSRQPNHPGVLQVDVDLRVDVTVVVVAFVVAFVVVDSSRQPHHPGVLQVSVLVLGDFEVDIVVDVMSVDVLLGFVPLLSKNSQGKQSVQFTYVSSTSLITLMILCVPIPTRQPRSLTVS
jgi:hypothetical protein